MGYLSLNWIQFLFYKTTSQASKLVNILPSRGNVIISSTSSSSSYLNLLISSFFISNPSKTGLKPLWSYMFFNAINAAFYILINGHYNNW